jgi:hypothetical protein
MAIPEPPPMIDRLWMAKEVVSKDIMRHTIMSQAMAQLILEGHVVFEPPDVLRLTTTGYLEQTKGTA